jgi:transposase
MSKIAVSVGLDYHPGSVQVCVLDEQGQVLANGTRANSGEELDRVARRYGERIRAAIEVSPGAANLADELVTRFGWSVDLAHPGYVARIKQSPDKTDFGDARLLADLTRVGYLPKVWLAPLEVRELRELVRYRQQLVHERRNTKLRVRALLRNQRLVGSMNAWTKAWLEWVRNEAPLPKHSRWVMTQQLSNLERLQQEIKQIEQRLEQVTKDDPLVQKLLEQEEVGLVTAVTLRAEIGRFDRFRSGKQLCRFCGLSPQNASSGARQADAGLVKASNPELRRVLIETGQRLANRSEMWSEFAARMRERGKSRSLIVATVANRWLRKLYHELKSVVA